MAWKKLQGLPENAERLEQLFGQQRRDLAIELQQLKEEALAQKAVVVEKADVDLTVPWLMKLKLFKNPKIPFVHWKNFEWFCQRLRYQLLTWVFSLHAFYVETDQYTCARARQKSEWSEFSDASLKSYWSGFVSFPFWMWHGWRHYLTVQRVLVCAYNTEVTIQKVQDVSQKMRESLENYRQTLKRLLVWFGLEGGRTGLGCLFVKCCLLSVSFKSELR